MAGGAGATVSCVAAGTAPCGCGTPTAVVTVAARNYPTRSFRVAGTHEKSMQTAQRLLVDEGA